MERSTGNMAIEPHEHASIFPMMDSSSFDELRADIRENGIQNPIVLLNGEILDGRNRYKAMRFIDPHFSPANHPDKFKEFDGDDPLRFVVSQNLHRRHLTDAQRSMIAAKLVGTTGQAQRKGKHYTGVTNIAAAQLMNVNRRQVEKAQRIQREEPSEVERIISGERKKVGAPFMGNVSFTLAPDEIILVRRAASRSGESIRSWGRRALLVTARIDLKMSAETPAHSPALDNLHQVSALKA